MRITFAGAAIALLSLATATPALAQFGGSPQQQVDGAPQERAQADGQDDEDDQVIAPDDDQAMAEAPDDGVAYGKPGADDDQGGAYADQGDADNDVDQDADVDADQGYAGNEADQGDADSDVDQGDVDNDTDQGDVEDQGQAEPGDGGVAGGGYAQTQTWQGEDGRTYCRRSDGTTGAVVGGGAGALVGRGIDGGRHRAGGTIIGAIAGALIGTAVEQSANRQRCS